MFADNKRNNYDNEDKSAESTLSSQKDNSLTMPSTSSNIVTEEVQLLVNFIEKAATAYSEGNLENALHYYEQAIMIDPGNNVLFANKSAILLKLGRIKEAIEEATHSVQLKPEWPKAHFRKAEAFKEAKEYEKAIISYSQAIQANSESQRFLNSLILCAQKSIIGEHFEAAYNQMKELGLERSQFVTISVIGQQFLGIHDFQTAISILKIALNIDSPSLKLKESTLGALAKAYYEAKNFSKAIDYLELQLELVTQLNDIKTEIQVHENISEIAEAQKEYQLALVHRDSQLRLCHQLGLAVASINCSKASIYEKMNDYLSAKECYKLALTENTESYDANFGIGNILFKKNDISDAIIAFIKAQEVAPSQDYRQLALIRICQCKLILGQTDEAINLLKTNLKTEKLLNPHILGNVLGIMCRAAEASDDVITFHRMAKRQLKLAIDTNNNLLKSEAFFSLAKFYERTNQRSNAKRLFELYLELIEKSEINYHPEQQILALTRLGKIEFESGNWEIAISITQKRLFLIKNLTNIEMEASAHADLISIYRKMANMEKCKEHIKALENLTSIATENTLLQVASVYDIEMGEIFMENKEWEKAKETFEKALIVVQELDKTEKEAELCEKLGIVHYKLERNEEAIVYFNQFLMISQQQKNANSMLDAYGHLTQVHLKLENLEEGFECAKFLLTLSDILNNSKEKITALLSIGRIFSKKDEHLIAIKILSKARRLAEKTDSKRELALCFGYLGECQLKINQRQKALTNFVKQLNYFPYINDAEDKCETIAHLIEEKILTNDVVWCAKLCRLQEDIAKEGPITLQMKVLRDSASKMHSLGCLDETTKSMEKALMLSIENEHPNTVTILLELCEYYCETQQYHKAILALKEFAELQDGICGPDVFYQLSIMLLTQNRIDESIENLEKCQTFDMVDNRFMYALSFAFYRKEDFKNAYFWLMQYIEVNVDAKNIQQEKLLWERCLLDYLCGNINSALKELKLLVRTNVEPMIHYLDAFNFYTELEADMESFLSLDCQIHFCIAKKDYDKANHYLKFYADTKSSYLFENIAVNLLLNNSTTISVDASFYNFTTEDYNPCFFKPSASQMSKALAVILAISNYPTVIESLRCVEAFLWKEAFNEFTKAGKSFDIPEPTFEDIKNATENLLTFFYNFSVDDISLIWIKDSYGKIEMFYNIESLAENLLPKFYNNVIKEVLFNSKIKQISVKSIDLFLQNCNICIGCNEVYKENYFSLLNFSISSFPDFPEALALFVDSKDVKPIENVITLQATSELSKQELFSRIAQTAVVFMDLDEISEELLHPNDLFETVMSTHLCILCTKTAPNRAVEISKNMILNGCQWVVIVDENKKAKNTLLNLLEGDLPKTISIETIKQLFANVYATFYTKLNSEKFIEVRGLSWMARRIICEEEYLDSYLKTEKDFTLYSFEFALHERLKQILSLHNDSITANDIAEIKHFSHETYPYTKLKEYIYRYDDQENIAKLFLDLLPFQNRITNRNLDSNELFQLMKSFEIRTKWRRRKKGKLSTRDYCSDGERFSVLSDKELTDSESVSGARVIGFDTEDAEYKY